MGEATPAGMKSVTKEAFYAHIGPLDVVLNVNSPDYTVWEMRDRREVGRSYPGWKYPGRKRAYFLSSPEPGR